MHFRYEFYDSKMRHLLGGVVSGDDPEEASQKAWRYYKNTNRDVKKIGLFKFYVHEIPSSDE